MFPKMIALEEHTLSLCETWCYAFARMRNFFGTTLLQDQGNPDDNGHIDNEVLAAPSEKSFLPSNGAEVRLSSRCSPVRRIERKIYRKRLHPIEIITIDDEFI